MTTINNNYYTSMVRKILYICKINEKLKITCMIASEITTIKEHLIRKNIDWTN